MTEKVEARELNRVNIHLEANRAFHFISKPLVGVLLKSISLTPDWFVLHHNTDWRGTHYLRGLLLHIGRFRQ